MHSRTMIGAIIAAASLSAAAPMVAEGPKQRARNNPKPTKEPVPQGELTRQQRRAAEREALKSASRWRQKGARP